MVLEAFKTSQSPHNYASNNQLEHLKKMGISKSHDDLSINSVSSGLKDSWRIFSPPLSSGQGQVIVGEPNPAMIRN